MIRPLELGLWAVTTGSILLVGCQSHPAEPAPNSGQISRPAGETKSGQPSTALPKVVVLTTGGTIATRVDRTTETALPALTGEDILGAVPWIKDIARIEVQNVTEVGSADITPAIWMDLLKRTRAALDRPDVSGVVITHGTDTLEETAYFLDLTINSQKPVIVVGAQRMASDPFPDGPRNLLDAVKVAAAPESVGQGVLVVMNSQINSAKDVTKTNTLAVGTFKSLEFGELGVVADNTVQFFRSPSQREHISLDPDTTLPRVDIIAHYAGADGSLISDLLGPRLWPRRHVDGLVIAATGLGHVSSSMYDEIKKARERGVAVVIATRVYTGPTLPLYPGKGLGISLRDIGCIFVKNHLNPQKARILLMLALTQTKDPAKLQTYFER